MGKVNGVAPSQATLRGSKTGLVDRKFLKNMCQANTLALLLDEYWGYVELWKGNWSTLQLTCGSARPLSWQ